MNVNKHLLGVALGLAIAAIATQQIEPIDTEDKEPLDPEPDLVGPRVE